MSIQNLLKEQREAVVEGWQDSILASYPAESAAFFKREKDAFHNPIGATVKSSSRVIVDWLAGEAAPEAMEAALDGIVRIRSLQEFTPATAVGFVLDLKRVVRGTIPQGREGEFAADLEGLDARIEGLLPRAFDCYTACRQRVFELRAREARASVSSLLRQAGLVPAGEGEPAARPRTAQAGPGAKGELQE
jgi:RsbT co-antagonist protein rsbRD N-terminal domain